MSEPGVGDLHEPSSWEARIPSMVVGSNALIQWFTSIQIHMTMFRLAAIRRGMSRTWTRCPGRTAAVVYSAQDIAALVREITGVPLRCWMAAREEDRAKGLDTIMLTDGGRPGQKVGARVSVNAGVDKVGSDPPHLYALVRTVRAGESGIMARPFEQVELGGRLGLMVTKFPSVASQWVPRGHGYPRIVEYQECFRCADPSVKSERVMKRKAHLPLKDGVLAKELLGAYRLAENGQVEGCLVPRGLLGYEPEGDPVPCMFCPGAPVRLAAAAYVKETYPTAWWWVWTRSREVEPVTLDPVPGTAERGRRKGDRDPESAIADF